MTYKLNFRLLLMLCVSITAVYSKIPVGDNFWWTDDQGSMVQQVYNQNSEAELSCPTNLQQPISITFLKDNQPFDKREFGKIVRVKNGIRLPDVLAQYDKGNYTCIVKNRQTEMIRTFQVDIISHYRGPPQFIRVPENTTRYEGEDVEFYCHYISGEEALVQWFKHYRVNGSYMDDRKDAYVTVIKTGSSGMERLTLYNVTLNDTGWYTCSVGNRFGQIHHSAWLTVNQTTSIDCCAATTTTSNVVILIVVSVLAVLFIAFIALVLCICHRLKPRRQRNEIKFMNNELYFPSNIPVDVKWEFNRENLQLGDLLGEGAFGKVYKGFALGIDGRMEPTVVAVKMLKDDATDKELNDLIQEMNTMKSIGRHKNIINMLGCCTQGDGPVEVIVEYASNGNLREFLQQRDPEILSPRYCQQMMVNDSRALLSYKHLISFAFQVARGMEYLASMKIIHRDLAARNVLVADDNVLKIADFGLTRNVNEKDYYLRSTDGRLPVKWMAPESLIENRYTIKSDVWSFGILLWEIFTFGSNPYPSVPLEDLFQLLRQGYRMEKPHFATDDVYIVMRHCWEYLASERPDFTQLVHCLDEMVSKSVGTNYLNLQSLPDVDDVADNEVFELPLLANADDRNSVVRSADSQYASMSNSEHTSSPANSLRSQTANYFESSIIEFGSDDDVA